MLLPEIRDLFIFFGSLELLRDLIMFIFIDSSCFCNDIHYGWPRGLRCAVLLPLEHSERGFDPTTRSMDLCLFVRLCCPAWVKTFRWTNLPTRESYKMLTNIIPKPGKTGGLGSHCSVVWFNKKKKSIILSYCLRIIHIKTINKNSQTK
jgi:hypothetical protein